MVHSCHRYIRSGGFVVFAVLFLAALAVLPALGQTVISDITASPAVFYADEGETTTITVNGSPGVSNLAVRVTLEDRSTVVRSSLALAEGTAGTYTTTWNGRNDSNSVVAPGLYAIRVFNLATSSYIGPWGEVEVATHQPTFSSASVTPSVFYATGQPTNTLQIHINATPLAEGNYTWGVYNNWLGWMVYKEALPEPTAPGEYDLTWDGVARYSYAGYMAANYGGYGDTHSYTKSYLVLWGPDGKQLNSPESAYFSVRGIHDLQREKSAFEPRSGETVTFTAVGYDGFNVYARITRDSTVIGDFPMTANGNGEYTFTWDGRDSEGNLVPTGSYSLRVFNADGDIPYHAANTSVTVQYTVQAISVSPNPFSPDGTGEPGQLATITVQAAPGQTGLQYGLYNNWLGWMVYKEALPESPTAGIYSVTFDGVSRYSHSGILGSNYFGYGDTHSYTNTEVRVWDANGQESIVRGTFKVQGIDRLERDRSQIAGGSETVTFTARGFSGFNVRLRVFPNGGDTAVRTGMMADNGDGTYTFEWDGLDDQGGALAPGSYRAYVYNADSDRRYYPDQSVNLTFSVQSISVDPDPFVPDGTPDTTTTITVNAAPGQVGLRYGLYNNWLGWLVYREDLPEVSPGVYKVSFDGVDRYSSYSGYIGNNYNLYGEDHSHNSTLVRVWDASNIQSQVEGSFKIRGISELDGLVSSFNPRADETVTWRARGYSGLPIELRIMRDSDDAIIRTVDMVDQGDGSYLFEWDGRDGEGAIQPPGSYIGYVYNKTGDRRYYPSDSVSVVFDVDGIDFDPDPFLPTGAETDVVTISVTTDPGQALEYQVNHQWLGVATPWTQLTEESPGLYQGTWDGVDHVSTYSDYIQAHPTYSARVYVRNAANIQAQTIGLLPVRGVSGISFDNDDFTPGGTNLATVNVNAESGLLLDAWVVNQATSVVTRKIELTEASGVYSGTWDGKDENGNFAGAGSYRFRPYNRVGEKPYYYWDDLTVRPAVFSITSDPDPFTPTGTNEVTLTLLADAGQAGLYARIYRTAGSYEQVSLVEAGSEGTYLATWDGRFGGELATSGMYTVRVFSSGGTEFPTTGLLTVTSVSTLALDPNPFEPGEGRTLQVSAAVGEGVVLPLEARVGTIKTLTLASDGAGNYTAEWDGQLDGGEFIGAGAHTVFLYNSETGQRYSPTAALTVVDNTAPTVVITGGPAQDSTVLPDVTFIWTGVDNVTPVGSLQFSYRMDEEEWSEFGTAKSKAYVLADGEHTFSVRGRDAAGNITEPAISRTFTVNSLPPGSIRATVTDNNLPGVPVEGAAVVVLAAGGEQVAAGVADAQGQIQFDGLTEGTYTVQASASGLEDGSSTAQVVSAQITQVKVMLAGSPSILVNGDFEEPVLGSQWQTYTSGQSIPGWTAGGAGVALIRSYWQSAHGSQSMELNNNGRGRVSQAVTAVPGKQYLLRFALSGQPDAGPQIKQVRVTFGGQEVDTIAFDSGGRSLASMGWGYHEYLVKSTQAEPVLVFDGVAPQTGDGGAVVDDVSLTLVANQGQTAFDLSLESSDISVNLQSPIMTGQVVEVGARIWNASDFDGTADVRFAVTDGQNTIDLGSVTDVAVQAGESAEVSVNHDTLGLNGTYHYVVTIENASPAESTSANNTASSGNVVITNVVPIYYGFNPNTSGQLRMVSYTDDTNYSIINLDDPENPISGGTLDRGQSTVFSLGSVSYFKVDADRPMLVHLGYDCCAFGGSYFYPALDGANRVGNEYIIEIPVLSGTSEFAIFAYDDASITISEEDPGAPGQTVPVHGPFELQQGQYWVTTGSPLQQGKLYFVSSTAPASNPGSTARIALQSNTGNGNAAVPSSNGRDMGTDFLFRTHSWLTGAIAVFAYQDATVTCVNQDNGTELFSVGLEAGQTYYRGGTGRNTYRITSTGNIAVWGGDLEGGGAIQDMGDDITINQGNGGREFYLHSQTQGAKIFCVYDGTQVTVRNVDTGVITNYTRDRDGYIAVDPMQVLHIVASKPVMVETAGGNGFNDWGNALNPVFSLDEDCAFPPVPRAGDDRTVAVGAEVTFDARQSSGNIISYAWDVDGDGVPESTSAVFTVIFDQATAEGEPLQVTLTVADEKGCQASDTVLVTVREPVPFDLGVLPQDIHLSPAPPVAGGAVVRVTADIHNVSDFAGTADVRFTTNDGNSVLNIGVVQDVPFAPMSVVPVWVDHQTTGLNGVFSYGVEILNASSTEGTLANNLAEVFDVVIDGQAPSVAITEGPAEGSTASTTVTFRWSGTDNFTPANQIVYSHRFDGGAWSAFTSSTSVTRSLAEGAHTFELRARDAAGNVSGEVVRNFISATITLSLSKSADKAVVAGGDLLTYTIAYTNNSAAPAVGAVLRDAIPANTAYVGGSTFLNGNAVADPQGGYAISSGVNLGTVAGNASGEVTFQVTVLSVSNGTTISNTAHANGGNLSGTSSSNQVTVTVNSPDTAAPETRITGGPGEGVKLCTDTATFSWTGSDDTTHISKLKYRWRLDGGAWNDFQSQTSQQLSGLTHGTHTFEVAAQDEAGKIDDTPALRSFRVDLQPPVISNVQVTPSQGQAIITWETDEPATSQVEYGATQAYGSVTPLIGQLKTSHSVTLTGLGPNTQYHFAVKSKDSCGHEAVSVDAAFTTTADTGAPETVITTGPSDGSRICSSSVDICWSGSDSVTPVAQLLYSWKMDGGVWSEPAPETCHQFTGLAAGTHTFYVRAHDGSGNVDSTPSQRTFIVDLDPPVITNVTVSAQANQVTITWLTDKPANSQVEFGTTEGYGSKSALNNAMATSHSVTISGLNPDSLYYFRAISTDPCQRTATSEGGSFTTSADNDVPNTWFTSGPVQNGKACTPDPEFCWTGSDNATPAENLQYSFSLNDGEWSEWSAETCVQFTGLSEANHVLAVKARDTSGNEDATPAVRNFRVDLTPPTIMNVSASPRTTSVIVSWITSEPTTSQVEYGPDATYGSATYIDTNPKTAHKMTITGLQASTEYHFRVVSSDGCHTATGSDSTFTTSEYRPPNLLIQSLSVPVSLTGRQDLAVTWSVKNQAFGDATGDWVDTLYLSEDETLDEADVQVLQFNQKGGLAAPFAYTQTQSAEMPIVAPGVYYMILHTDSEDAVGETNEDDNIFMQPVSVTVAQQLIAAPDPIPLVVNPTVPVSGQIELSNLGTAALTNLSATVQQASSNLNVQISGLPSTLSGLSSVKVNYQVLAADESVLESSPVVAFTTAEGHEAEITMNVNVIPRQPKLIANPGYLQTSMLRGAQKIVECVVTNQGGVPATNVQVLLPPTSWLKLASPQNIGTIAPGQSVNIALQLTPPPDLQLGPYNGSLVVAGSNGGVNIGFQFRAISDQVGDLKVYCNDEFTYFAEGNPRVNNATVILRDAVTGEKLWEEISGVTGIVLKEGVTEGYYELEVRAEKHGTFKQPVQLVAGELKEVNAFLPRQLVSYTWTVEPVEIEDRYKVSIEAVFETHVPAPVLTVDPPYAMVPVLEGETTVVNFTITNHGLIAAQGAEINFGTSDEYYIIPLIKDIGVVPAQSSLVVPVLFRAKADGWPEDVPQVATATGAARMQEQMTAVSLESMERQSEWDKPCDLSIKGEVIYFYVCDGERWRQESIDTTIFKIGKALWDAVKCGFDVAVCASGVVDGIGLAKCPDAIRCLFKYACESLSALTGAPCCICKMTSAILGDTGALPDAAKCLPLPTGGGPPRSTGGGGPSGGGGGFYGAPYVTPWGFNQGGAGCGPAPGGDSLSSSMFGSEDAAGMEAPATDDSALPEDNGDAVIRQYGGKVIRTNINVL